VINIYRCPQYHEGEELGIELTIELAMQNSKHKCWWQHATMDMCRKLSWADKNWLPC